MTPKQSISATLSPADRTRVIRSVRIPEQVAADIRKRVLSGEIREGDVLPAESELMVQYGVSRPTLREALRILEAERLIVVRRGGIGGAVVQGPNLDLAARQFGFVLQHRGVTVADVGRARATVEPAAVAALAGVATRAQLAELNAMLDEAERSIGDPPRFSHAIEVFHERIVQMTGAATVALLMRMLREVMERHAAATGAIAPTRWTELQVISLRAQRKLVDLIGEGDRAAVEAYWRLHLEEVQKHMGPVATIRVIDVLD